MVRVKAAVCAALIAGILAAGQVSAHAQTVPGPLARPARASIDYGTAHLERTLPATRTAAPIALDGVLDEPAWELAPMARNFIQNDPREGEPATFDTEVRVLYDDEALYFGVFAKDEQPDRIISNDLKKDFNTGQSDGFRIILDTFHDGRNGYQFATNPAGAKWDSQMANEGREKNDSWDGIWEVRTRTTDAGWFAEFRIPFRTLKFTAEDVQTWGMNFERKLRRLNEDSYWAPLPRVYELERVSIAGTMTDVRGVRPGKNLRVKPYAASNASTIGNRPTSNDFDAGLDVKYGVTSGLVWDFTVNTDFSQAEADEQQINLTRLSLFFPEKRDFFLDNSGIFTFGGNGRNQGGANAANGQNPNSANTVQLFFSRQIGLSENGEPIPIVGGTRLSGRQGAYSIGVLNMQQREMGNTPATNFTVFRMRRDVLANSDIGAVMLNTEQGGPHFNRVGGVDANFRFGQFLSINGWVAKSFSADGSVPRIGNEIAGDAGFNYSSRTWQLQTDFKTVGNGFNDELGFIQRYGVNNVNGRWGRQFRPRTVARWIRQMQPHVEYDDFHRQSDGELDSRYINYHFNVNFQDGSNSEIGYNSSDEHILTAFTINSARGVRVDPGHYEFGEYFIFWNTNNAARISFSNKFGVGPYYDGYRRNYIVGPLIRVSENLNASVGLQINDITLSTGSFVSKLLTTRVNYNFNTSMFFNALVQYNSDSRQWSSNLRFNVIHRPLSDFFLVYNERRDDRTGILLNRAVIAKMTYMMAF